MGLRNSSRDVAQVPWTAVATPVSQGCLGSINTGMVLNFYLIDILKIVPLFSLAYLVQRERPAYIPFYVIFSCMSTLLLNSTKKQPSIQVSYCPCSRSNKCVLLLRGSLPSLFPLVSHMPGGSSVLFRGAMASSAATFVSHYPWFTVPWLRVFR